jgi:predicted DsbA family dithiol-disulfide isomerase
VKHRLSRITASRRDVQEGRRPGVIGVPFALLDGRFGIPGAVSAADYGRAIAAARSTR